MKPKNFDSLLCSLGRRGQQSGSGFTLRTTNALILTDDVEFARLLSACWQMERQLAGLSVVTSDLWKTGTTSAPDLIVIGPLKEGKLLEVLGSIAPGSAVILCGPTDPNELGLLRNRYPRLLHVPLREDWAQVVLLVAGESLRRTEATRLAKQAEQRAAQNANQAVLGRYMIDMKHSMNNAMTSLLGNAELLLLEPGELSGQSLAQIKTIHTMALRINEIMQRFSSLASEMREAETTSQAETEEFGATLFPRR
jgi:signal transduction histidine kinase